MSFYGGVLLMRWQQQGQPWASSPQSEKTEHKLQIKTNNKLQETLHRKKYDFSAHDETAPS